MRTSTVITTIQSPTPSLLLLAEHLYEIGENLIVIGDKKSPLEYKLNHGAFFSAEAQQALSWKIVNAIPWNSYSRKMVGYLLAADQGSLYIRETDDDNRPLSGFFDPIPHELKVRIPAASGEWINPYAYFTETDIWPRGLPLQEIGDVRKQVSQSLVRREEIGVLQGLANGSPDVDAIYRLTRNDVTDYEFDVQDPLQIPLGCYTPFNSQATLWNIKLLPLMYLPSTCSFRMTDIWRSFIALRIMRETNYYLIFTRATMFQDRNTHNLLDDFESEISGYLGNSRLVQEIENVVFNSNNTNFSDQLRLIYSRLIECGFMDAIEMEMLEAWLFDCDSLTSSKHRV